MAVKRVLEKYKGLNEGYKKGEMVLIVGDGNATSLKMNFEKMQDQIMYLDIETVNVAFLKLGVSAKEASESLMELAKLDNIINPKTVVMDSFIEESASISKKEWKKLAKRIKKTLNLKPQKQSEIWSNKWNKKIKRKPK